MCYRGSQPGTRTFFEISLSTIWNILRQVREKSLGFFIFSVFCILRSFSEDLLTFFKHSLSFLCAFSSQSPATLWTFSRYSVGITRHSPSFQKREEKRKQEIKRRKREEGRGREKCREQGREKGDLAQINIFR